LGTGQNAALLVVRVTLDPGLDRVAVIEALTLDHALDPVGLDHPLDLVANPVEFDHHGNLP